MLLLILRSNSNTLTYFTLYQLLLVKFTLQQVKFNFTTWLKPCLSQVKNIYKCIETITYIHKKISELASSDIYVGKCQKTA